MERSFPRGEDEGGLVKPHPFGAKRRSPVRERRIEIFISVCPSKLLEGLADVVRARWGFRRDVAREFEPDFA